MNRVNKFTKIKMRETQLELSNKPSELPRNGGRNLLNMPHCVQVILLLRVFNPALVLPCHFGAEDILSSHCRQGRPNRPVLYRSDV